MSATLSDRVEPRATGRHSAGLPAQHARADPGRDRDPSPAAGEPDAVRPRRRRGVVREVILNVAAVGGALCIALTLAAVLFNVTLIMFKTGSMSPSIPAGSLAVVREIPAADAKVGDVVTVARPDKLPVTHRIVSTEPAGNGLTQLVLKGDANPVNDPEPYLVSTVRVVMGSVPGLASVVVAVSNPLAMGIITVAVASLVTWVFWPRQGSGGIPRGTTTDSTAGGAPEPDPDSARAHAGRVGTDQPGTDQPGADQAPRVPTATSG